jgi:hypothetical protein
VTHRIFIPTVRVRGLSYQCRNCLGRYTARRKDHVYCSTACQQDYYNAHRAKRPIMVVEHVCDMCGSSSRERRLSRFSLRKSVMVRGKYTSRGVGTIFLCESCWKRTAGSRRKQTGPRHIVESVSAVAA